MIQCTFEDGGTTSLRHVTVNTIVVKNGKVLLGKRVAKVGLNLEGGKWSLLGGFVNRDEALIDAAKREILEESGWEVDHLQTFRIKDKPDRPKEDRQNIEFVFIAEAIQKIGIPDGEAEPQWFDVDKTPEEMAFDHGEDLELYKRFLESPFPLPIFQIKVSQ